MNLEQKLQVARALRDLGVDVIEAGFAAASPGDLEAIRGVGQQIEGPIIASLSRRAAAATSSSPPRPSTATSS
jgi:2-isopropylmalate synthase